MKHKLEEWIKDEAALEARLIELSRDGQAWTYFVRPFSHQTRFFAASSPSRFSDQLYQSGNVIGWKGKLVPFSNAAIIREQNRGLGRG